MGARNRCPRRIRGGGAAAGERVSGAVRPRTERVAAAEYCRAFPTFLSASRSYDRLRRPGTTPVMRKGRVPLGRTPGTAGRGKGEMAAVRPRAERVVAAKHIPDGTGGTRSLHYGIGQSGTGMVGAGYCAPGYRRAAAGRGVSGAVRPRTERVVAAKHIPGRNGSSGRVLPCVPYIFECLAIVLPTTAARQRPLSGAKAVSGRPTRRVAGGSLHFRVGE